MQCSCWMMTMSSVFFEKIVLLWMIYMLEIFVCDMFKGSRERKAIMFGKGVTWLQPNLVMALSSSSLSLSSTLMTYECLRDEWFVDWTDQRVFINTDFRLLFDALLKLLTQLPQYPIVYIREWSSSDSFKLLHALDAEWIKVAKE